MDEIFASPRGVEWQVCFTGHTHFPGIFSQENPYRFHEPRALSHTFDLVGLDHRIIVNVGSVGQPRDGDNRSSYVILEDTQLRFKRIEYDVQATIARFKDTELPEYLARRLEEGK